MEDAVQCATSLGMSYETISIEPLVEAFTQSLKNATKDATSPLWEENIQSRIRGNLLMAYSNANGAMVLTTGNKSEMAVGYATLYGDMCGGYNVLKDIYKTKVYELSYWRNSTSPDAPAIPERVLTKVPSAELRENQSDQDSLPDYAILDDILYKLIEERASTDTIIDSGHDAATVKRVALLVKMAEYKRRQAPPGVKLSALAFGRDRRYPITHHFDF
jgi:NAD+ synthase